MTKIRKAHVADIRTLHATLVKAESINRRIIARDQQAREAFGIEAESLGLTGGAFEPLSINACGSGRFESWQQYIAKAFGVA